jgi:dsDNA-specific endonuclease/ATPase MutS2
MSAEPARIPIEGELDLHAFSPRDIPSVVSEYVDAAAAAGLTEIRLIHGRGRGVQRGIVQKVLDGHPVVDAFWDDTDAHLGATIARLRLAGPAKTGA